MIRAVGSGSRRLWARALALLAAAVAAAGCALTKRTWRRPLLRAH